MDQTENGKALAHHLGETYFQAHRGAFIRGNALVVFGNDGYQQDERARREVDAVLAWGKTQGLRVTDFGTDPEDGYSWVLVFTGAKPDELADLALAAEDVLWRAWHGDNPDPSQRAFEACQRQQALLAGDEQ